ncbi:MAG: tetratricopeptide repeat protein [Alphaproteobacteria bacterium]|nr:tetratricopeptide repeat protein [Alphaproteobacteria bacterium]
MAMKKESRQRQGAAPGRFGPRGGVEALWQQAILAHRGGKLDDAQTLYRRILSAAPSHAGSHNNLGLIHRIRGDAATAEAAFRAAVDADSGFAEAYHNLGNTLRDLSRSTDSIAAYRAAIRCRPGYRDAHAGNAGTVIAPGRTGDGADAGIAARDQEAGGAAL